MGTINSCKTNLSKNPLSTFNILKTYQTFLPLFHFQTLPIEAKTFFSYLLIFIPASTITWNMTIIAMVRIVN